MGLIKLELRCPKEVNGVSRDPNPNWNFNDLLSELSMLESKLNNASDSPLNPKPFTKTVFREIPRFDKFEQNEEKKKAFVMRVDDDEMDESDSEGGTEARSLVPARRFIWNEIYLSESEYSDDEEMLQVAIMAKNGVAKGAFLEVAHEHQLGIKEEIRNQLAAVETQLVAEKEKSTSALVQVEKNADAKRQMDRKLDLLYQRKIAEALDDHLTAIQRDHEHRTQLEERRIRDDAAFEEVKRKEKALQEEKMRQQKAKEEEIRREAAKRAEEERKAAQEAERLAKEAADKLAKENSAKESVNALTGNTLTSPPTTSAPNVPKEVKSGGLLRAAENALKLEERRVQICKELEDRNQSIISGSNLDLRRKDREISKQIRQISGSIDSVRSKANELVKIVNDPSLPQSVTVEMFAKKIISTFDTPSPSFDGYAFACAHVIVYVSAQVPAVMDHLLAEFHKACIYTVPKHIVNSKAAFEKTETYLKAIGYREEDGKIEDTDSYVKRLESVMKLYGALVQTEAGVQNMHGLEEGWAWLARLLNALPANKYTAVALDAFLGMAGFALHRRYQSQFRKILDLISREFVPALAARRDTADVIQKLQQYIGSRKFLEEPVGWRLEATLLSGVYAP